MFEPSRYATYEEVASSKDHRQIKKQDSSDGDKTLSPDPQKDYDDYTLISSVDNNSERAKGDESDMPPDVTEEVQSLGTVESRPFEAAVEEISTITSTHEKAELVNEDEHKAKSDYIVVDLLEENISTKERNLLEITTDTPSTEEKHLLDGNRSPQLQPTNQSETRVKTVVSTGAVPQEVSRNIGDLSVTDRRDDIVAETDTGSKTTKVDLDTSASSVVSNISMAENTGEQEVADSSANSHDSKKIEDVSKTTTGLVTSEADKDANESVKLCTTDDDIINKEEETSSEEDKAVTTPDNPLLPSPKETEKSENTGMSMLKRVGNAVYTRTAQVMQKLSSSPQVFKTGPKIEVKVHVVIPRDIQSQKKKLYIILQDVDNQTYKHQMKFER